MLLYTDSGTRRFNGQAFQSYGYLAIPHFNPDDNRPIVHSGCGASTGHTNVIMGECEAILQAMSHLNARGLNDSAIQLHCDSLHLVNALNGVSKPQKSYFERAVNNILDWRHELVFPVKWVPREQNRGADHLASFAIMQLMQDERLHAKSLRQWVQFTPPPVLVKHGKNIPMFQF